MRPVEKMSTSELLSELKELAVETSLGDMNHDGSSQDRLLAVEQELRTRAQPSSSGDGNQEIAGAVGEVLYNVLMDRFRYMSSLVSRERLTLVDMLIGVVLLAQRNAVDPYKLSGLVHAVCELFRLNKEKLSSVIKDVVDEH